MSPSPPRSRGAAPTPRQASYTADRPYTSGPASKSRRRNAAEVVQARILATLALTGPTEPSGLRACGWLVGPTATMLCNALSALVAAGLVEAVERSEIAVVDGMRCRRDFLLYSLAKPAGGGR